MSIFARSPYIVDIDETGQEGGMVQLFLYNTGSVPLYPTHTLNKLVPSATNTKLYFNISPYIREYLNFNYLQTPYNTIGNTVSDQVCKVRVKRYKLVSGTYTLLDTTDYLAYDGYGYYTEGTNPDLSPQHLDEGTYFYHYDPNGDPSTDEWLRGGHITFENQTGWFVRYTNLKTGAISTLSTGSGQIVDIPRVNALFYADGNKLEFLNASLNVKATYYFRPLEECRYTPVVCDFVNKYGAWSRLFFFKASNDIMNTQSTVYNLMQSELSTYDVLEGQRKEFNLNGIESIKVNTGFIGEYIGEEIRQLMLSERILLDSKPVKLSTRSQERYKVVNTKTINYNLEFEFAYDTINSVI